MSVECSDSLSMIRPVRPASSQLPSSSSPSPTLADIASHAGQRLLCRTEYNAGAEAEATLLYAKRSGTEVEVKQNGILYGSFSLTLPSPARR